jgi:uncharacterized protein (TIGR02145 family)
MEHIGKQIGKYTITKFIGEGGMASVYEGEHEALGTKAAIKILNPILSANKQIRERFKNEARIMASLDHPNIIRVYDYEESDTYLAIAMELLKGEDLSERIKRMGSLSEEELKHIFNQVLSAFEYAHSLGIVHRDIKPSNIFVLSNGTVKILDFGIAKLFGQGNEMTQTGTQMGTPVYMSPEQVKADKSIDHRSDIYSLGVTMFYALSGKSPYDVNTNSQFDIFTKIVHEALPELESTSYLAELVRKACQKDRELRFQSCEEWLQQLKKGAAPKTDLLSVEETTSNQELSKKNAKVVEALDEQSADDQIAADKTQIDISTSSPKEKLPEQLNKNQGSIINKKILFVFGIVAVLIMVTIVRGGFFRTDTGKKDEIENATPEATAQPLIEDPVADINGTVYKTVIIGEQLWMSENLNVDKFRNGDLIPEAKTDAEWKRAGENKQPAWCYYDNNPENGTKYGKLYNWYAVSDSRGLAPTGWHIPTDGELTLLSNFLGGHEIAGLKMKSIDGWDLYVDKLSGEEIGKGTNESGFSGLPGGYRCPDGDYDFYGIGQCSDFWGASFDDKEYARNYYFLNYNSVLEKNYISRNYKGKSVRCLRD